MRQPAALQNLFRLSCSVRLYVPSTMDVDVAMRENEHAEEVNHALAKLGSWFGGATSYEALGAWVSPEAGLVKERVTIVESYCSEEDLQGHAQEFVEYAEDMKKRLGQEAVSVEVNNELYFI